MEMSIGESEPCLQFNEKYCVYPVLLTDISYVG